MVTSDVDRFIREDDMSLYEFNDAMYQTLIDQSEIEKQKLENIVFERMKEGKNKKEVVQWLQKQYPDNPKFTVSDFNRFLARNSEVSKKLVSTSKQWEERQMSARLNLITKMGNLTERIETLMDKWEKDDNAPAINAAISNLLKTWMNTAELMGLLQKKEDQKDETVIRIISDKREKLVEKLHMVNFIEGEVIEGEVECNTTSQENQKDSEVTKI